MTVVRTDASRWATQINNAWRSSIEGILEAGHLLRKAKEDLGHGKFLNMIESELPFSVAMAQRLMKIAADQRITNTEHVPHLPASWGTLYELTKLDTRTFVRAIADGAIHVCMTRAAATSLRHRSANENVVDRKDEFAAVMKMLAFRQDRSAAIDLMAKTLRGLGYGRGIDIFESIP